MQSAAVTAKTPDASSAHELLTWGRTHIEPELRRAIDLLPDRLRLVSGYHLGWWDARGRTLGTGSTGKYLRPTLALLSSLAVGGTTADALAVATATELLHNFSLLHDDVIDNDDTRHHRPTAWTVYGRADALLAGDGLLALTFRWVAREPSEDCGLIVDRLAQSVTSLCQGESDDLAFEIQSAISLDSYIDMAANKTAALLSTACVVGGISGGASGPQLRSLETFGHHAGLAFQIGDDLLGIWGEHKATGKSTHSDVARRKKSLPIVAAMNAGTPEAQLLQDLYSNACVAEGDVEIVRLVERLGGRQWAQARAAHELAQALQILDDGAWRDQPSSGLRTLIRYIADRKA